MNPIRDTNNKAVTFTTDTNGEATIEGDMDNLGWTLVKGQKYYLKELVAPNGYKVIGYEPEFTIGDQPDYSKWIYYSGDSIAVKNYPGTDLTVLKKWSNQIACFKGT